MFTLNSFNFFQAFGEGGGEGETEFNFETGNQFFHSV